MTLAFMVGAGDAWVVFFSEVLAVVSGDCGSGEHTTHQTLVTDWHAGYNCHAQHTHTHPLVSRL